MDVQETNDETKVKKNKLAEAAKKFGRMIYEVLKEYPVTIGAILIAAFIGALLVSWDDRGSRDILEKIAAFFLLISFQVLMLEEIFKRKLVVRIAGSVVAAAISAFYVSILSTEKEVLFGIQADTVHEIALRILVVYAVVVIGFAIYHMYRRLEEDFEIYCTKAFLGLIRATVVYGLFALGLAIIILIFDELIFDTGDFLARVEVFLAGGIYVPMCLKAISGKNEKPGKFAGFCVLYVLRPMLILAFAIIYLYIVKIFVTDAVPSNRIFPILAFLFAIGLPVWTMVHGVGEKDGLLSRASVFLPYVFVPFVALQCWSIGVRIRDYGFTTSRYSAVVLIVGEILYFILYLVHRRWKKQVLAWILFALMAMAAIGLLMPGLSYDDVIIRSQMRRLHEMLESGEPTGKMKSAIKSAYREIDWVGYKGERVLKEQLSKEQMDEIEKYDEWSSWRNTTVYLDDGFEFTDMDISGYRHLYSVSSVDVVNGNRVEIQVNDKGSDEDKERYTVDMSELIDWAVDHFDVDNEYDFSLEGREQYKLDDKRDLYITQITISFDAETKEIGNLYFSGYLLER